MSNYNTCLFHGVSEREMDILFLQAFSIFPEFGKLFLNQTKWKDTEITVTGVELSKTDAALGESDITVYLDATGHRYALLIEDKIDAVAMQEQHGRYVKRGDKAVRKKEYEDYEIFIVCPKKYRSRDDEAQKYEHFVSYEECLAFFEKVESPAAKIFVQQIQQALDTARTAAHVEINEIAVQSFMQYSFYQRENYPKLKLRNDSSSGKVNGWWPHFLVPLKNAYIIHKTPQGYVDLTIGHTAQKIDKLEKVAEYFSKYYGRTIEAAVTNKSAALRIRVPVIKMGTPFDTWDIEKLNACFDAVSQLTEIAAALQAVRDFYET